MCFDPMCATRPRVCLVAAVTFVSWIVCTSTEGFDCVQPSPVYSTNTCYRGVTLSANSSSCLDGHFSCATRPDDIIWTPVNISTGLFEVSFPFANPGCNFSEYSLQLQVHAHPHPHLSSQQECQRTTSFTQIHSKRKYWVKNAVCDTSNSSDCSVCGKTGLVRFQFVFTGCYQLVITPKTEPVTHRAIVSCPVFLETTYKKALISTEQPAFREQQQQALMEIRFTFGPLTCSVLEVEIELVKNVNLTLKDPCYRTGRPHSQCTIRHDKTSCVESDMPGTPNADCKIDANQVICSFKPISEGNYCAIMTVSDDDRCVAGTLWMPTEKDNCAWHGEFIWHGSSGEDLKIFPSEESSGLSYTLVAGAALLFVIFALAMLAVWVKFRLLNSTTGCSNQDRCDGLVSTALATEAGRGAEGGRRGRYGVLLLYARDCEPFMKVMQSFRCLLEDAFQLEVYDCFDPLRWEQVCRSPTEWMRRVALHPEVKVIAVASTCASLRLQAQLTNTRLVYAEPSCVDELFVYALQLVGESVHRDNGYQKMSVVRLDGFSDDVDLFSHLNSYTRYVLPAHLDLLGNNLHPGSPVESLRTMSHEQVQPFRQDLNKLVNYRNENVQYLDDFLLLRKCSSL